MGKLSPIVIAVTLGVVMVLVAGSITVEDVKVLKAIFCDPDNAEVAKRAYACLAYLQDMPLTFFELSGECCLPQGSNATATSLNMTERVSKYYCETSAETMIECNACQERRIDELHEGKHEILGVLRVIGECFANAVTSEGD